MQKLGGALASMNKSLAQINKSPDGGAVLLSELNSMC